MNEKKRYFRQECKSAHVYCVIYYLNISPNSCVLPLHGRWLQKKR